MKRKPKIEELIFAKRGKQKQNENLRTKYKCLDDEATPQLDTVTL